MKSDFGHVLANTISGTPAKRSGHSLHIRRRIQPPFGNEVVGVGEDFCISRSGVGVRLDHRAIRDELASNVSTWGYSWQGDIQGAEQSKRFLNYTAEVCLEIFVSYMDDSTTQRKTTLLEKWWNIGIPILKLFHTPASLQDRGMLL